MSSLTVSVNVSQTGNVTLNAAETNDPGTFADDLIINAGVTVSSSGGNVFLQAGDDILLNGIAASPTGILALRAGTGDLDGGGGITQDANNGLVLAASMGVRAIGSVTLTRPSNDVDFLAAAVTGAGASFNYRDVDDVSIRTVDGVSGVTTIDGEILITSLSGSIILDGSGADEIFASIGDITLNAANDVVVHNQSAIDSNNGDVEINAGRDILLGSTALDRFGDVEATSGNVELDADRDIIIDENSDVQVFGTGSLAVIAGRNISILASDGTSGSSLMTQGGGVFLQTGVNGMLTIDSNDGLGAIRTTEAGGNGSITIAADRMNLTAGDSVQAGTAPCRSGP